MNPVIALGRPLRLSGPRNCREGLILGPCPLPFEKGLTTLLAQVWQQSNIVVQVATEMEAQLGDLGIVSEDAVAASKSPVVQPDEISLKLLGGPGAIQTMDLDKPDTVTP